MEREIRRCDNCGKPMKEGYYLAGEFACSDECCLALYNGDKAQMEEDLSHAEEISSDIYYMSPVDVDLRGLWLAVAKPMNEGVSTKEAYSGIKPQQPTTSLTELLKADIHEWQGSVVNDFEPHIFVAHPAIAALKQQMQDAGAIYAAMSGSGSVVFGLFDHKPCLQLGDDVFIHCECIV